MRNQPRRRPPHQAAPNYTRRRIVVLAVLVTVVALIWWAISTIVGFVNSIFHPAAQPSASVSATGDPNALCAPGAVAVIAGVGNQAGVNATSFAANETPFLWFKLTNNSTQPCTFDAGSAGVFFKISSGSTVYWDTHDCDRSQDTSNPIVLQPGATVTSQTSSWMKVSSSSTGCSTGQKAVPTGGASYHMVAVVNGVVSSDVQFMLN